MVSGKVLLVFGVGTLNINGLGTVKNILHV